LEAGKFLVKTDLVFPQLVPSGANHVSCFGGGAIQLIHAELDGNETVINNASHEQGTNNIAAFINIQAGVGTQYCINKDASVHPHRLSSTIPTRRRPMQPSSTKTIPTRRRPMPTASSTNGRSRPSLTPTDHQQPIQT